MSDLHKADNLKFDKLLLGRKIVGMRRMSEEEMKDFGWYANPMVLILDDGTFVIPQRDDEGNDGGSLFISSKDDEALIYVT